MNIQITEGRFPRVSAVARTDEIESTANYVWERLSNAIMMARAAVTNLNGSLHSSGVEEAETLLDEMMHAATTLTDRIEAQRAIQIEYRRGDR